MNKKQQRIKNWQVERYRDMSISDIVMKEGKFIRQVIANLRGTVGSYSNKTKVQVEKIIEQDYDMLELTIAQDIQNHGKEGVERRILWGLKYDIPEKTAITIAKRLNVPLEDLLKNRGKMRDLITILKQEGKLDKNFNLEINTSSFAQVLSAYGEYNQDRNQTKIYRDMKDKYIREGMNASDASRAASKYISMYFYGSD